METEAGREECRWAGDLKDKRQQLAEELCSTERRSCGPFCQEQVPADLTY